METCKSLPNFRDVNFCFKSVDQQVESKMLKHVLTKFHQRSKFDNDI
jgi:hypothetical protein